MTKEQEALKLALEALEDENSLTKMKTARSILRNALAQTSTQCKEQPVQEPVATVSRNQDDSLVFKQLRDFYVVNGMSLYTTPQQHPWVSLSDEQYDEIWRMDLNNRELMDATIAALKEKNT